MTRRLLVGATVASALRAGEKPYRNRKSKKRVIIPPAVEKEIIKILEAGGRIIGFSHREPSEFYAGQETIGQRFLTKKREQRWRIVSV